MSEGWKREQRGVRRVYKCMKPREVRSTSTPQRLRKSRQGEGRDAKTKLNREKEGSTSSSFNTRGQPQQQHRQPIRFTLRKT